MCIERRQSFQLRTTDTFEYVEKSFNAMSWIAEEYLLIRNPQPYFYEGNHHRFDTSEGNFSWPHSAPLATQGSLSRSAKFPY